MASKKRKPAPPRGVLMQYKGGGYDGCMWEWNYCYWDNYGRWHDLYSSGYRAANTKEKALLLHRERPLEDSNTTVYLYHTNFAECIREFQEHTNPGHVVGVTNAVNKLRAKKVLWFNCDECGQRSYEGAADGVVGAGGVAVQANTKLYLGCAEAGGA